MRIRKIKRRLAVSTVIGNMLMIAITLSLAAILVAWAGTTYGAFTGGSQVYFAQRQQALQERFVIENVYFNKTGTPPTMLIFLRNVGVEEVKIAAIYVNGTSLTPQTGHTWLCTTLPYTLSVQGVSNVQSVCEFSVDVSSVVSGGAICTSIPWCSGAIFLIVVTSARGNQVTYTARGP